MSACGQSDVVEKTVAENEKCAGSVILIHNDKVGLQAKAHSRDGGGDAEGSILSHDGD